MNNGASSLFSTIPTKSKHVFLWQRYFPGEFMVERRGVEGKQQEWCIERRGRDGERKTWRKKRESSVLCLFPVQLDITIHPQVYDACTFLWEEKLVTGSIGSVWWQHNLCGKWRSVQQNIYWSKPDFNSTTEKGQRGKWKYTCRSDQPPRNSVWNAARPEMT